ncbi:replication initiator, partial [Nonomuraea phyllanthi]|uniref:replication initiator n=1 Tax=Nonomuraea phyllanthi TaxID=2219224 RepID=UPI0029394839
TACTTSARNSGGYILGFFATCFLSGLSLTLLGSESGRVGAPHARRLIAACMRLGGNPGLADLRLIHWAHMLGFRGHFSTKSRRYSTTLGNLRAAREEHARAEEISTGRLPLFDEDTVLVIVHWEYAGQGLSIGEQALAAAITGTRLPGVADE